VCGKASYSRTGVHPQCALARADAITAAARRAANPNPKKPVRKAWSKTCPKCQCEIPARRFACECGHKFGAMVEGGTNGAAHQQPEPSGKKPR
jgi:hypothetical protein